MKTLKMQCCVPFCQTTAEIVSKSTGITFHKFPNEVPLRAAWLRALGNQDTLLSEHAVVCSLHFLNDEICTTDSGSRQIRTGAIPSMVQVCMICLDAHSKLFLMSKYKLDEAYQHLVGLPLCDPGNLKQTACIQCAQRLMNFSRFRDKSLRARALMMELVGKYELISMQHMGMFNEVNNKLKHNIVKTILHPDHCDLYINSDTDKQTEATASVESVTIKNEENVPMSVDEDDTENVVVRTDTDKGFNINLVVTKEEYLSDEEPKQLTDPLFVKPSTSKEPTELMAPIKYEITFECSICMEEFADEDTYNYHMTMHMEEDQSLTEEPIAEFGHSSSSSSVAPLPWGLATDTTSLPEVSTTTIEPVIKKEKRKKRSVSKKLVSELDSETNADDVLKSILHQNLGVRIKKLPNTDKKFSCEFCVYKTNHSEAMQRHVRGHTGEKPYPCDVCEYRSARRSDILRHMRIHTRKFSCGLCQYTTTRSTDLERHKNIHTGKKPFSCELCNYKCSRHCYLTRHMSTHTGETPYACGFCDFKCRSHNVLVHHLTKHSNQNLFSCKLCSYKAKGKIDLNIHMRTHPGEETLICQVCDHKFLRRRNLVRHMMIHSGEKPFSCDLCHYKCARKGDIRRHMLVHSGKKPFACELCDYKCARKADLTPHLRTHIGY
ncbi:zinc finger protein 436-like isoform X5 [Maniola hyperantus]|uniref:zinc finger protein 436-like isoform X5 n=1 Tax=Aphantopus hyperantus TaxID=2795564 RepID=UPI00213FD85A